MSVPAARIRTSSGWRDLAIQGAPGVPGYTPSAKGYGFMTFAAADMAHRIYAPPMTTEWDQLGGASFADNTGAFTTRVAGKFLIIMVVDQISVAGNVHVGIIRNNTTAETGVTAANPTLSDGAIKGGNSHTWIMNLNANDYVRYFGCHSGGGTAYMQLLVVRLDAPVTNIITNIPLVSTLPASPVDGQEIYYLADATNGIIWHLRYRAAASGAYKWEFVGGSSLFSEVTTAEATTTSTYVALATAGPLITLPLAGDYMVEHGMIGHSGADDVIALMSYDIGATAAGDGDSCQAAYGKIGPGTARSSAPSVMRSRRKNAIAAATTLTAKYRSSFAGVNVNLSARWMNVTPIRVG